MTLHILRLGPFSCFCLCVERGSLDAGAQLALAQAGVRNSGFHVGFVDQMGWLVTTDQHLRKKQLIC